MTATRSFCVSVMHQSLLFLPIEPSTKVFPLSRCEQSPCGAVNNRRTFNMCNSVVLPALSRPRNRSLACLFSRPREARASQTSMHRISQGGPDILIP